MEDRGYDLRMSYSKLDTFVNCPYQYYLKYECGYYPNNPNTLVLNVGTLCHKVLELKAQSVINKEEKVSYEVLNDVLYNGYHEKLTEKDAKGEDIAGITELKQKYDIIDWYKDNDGGNYEVKMKRFSEEVLPNRIVEGEKQELEPTDWQVAYSELPFKFYLETPLKDEIKTTRFEGFIDRVDIRTNTKGETEYRVVDYKTSKKVYKSDKLATPLQMVIYGIAIENMFGVLPVEYMYDFILINEQQQACTKGYYKRGLAKIEKTLTEIFESSANDNWNSKPTPLCHWCNYCETNQDAEETYKHECQDYSFWTPENPTYESKKDDIFAYKPKKEPMKLGSGRKLIF